MSLAIQNQLGRRIAIRVGANVTSGTIVRTTGIVGMPVMNVLSGNTCTFQMEGLVLLTLSTLGGTIAAGCFLYWNRTATPTANALSLGAAAGDIPVAQILSLDQKGQQYLCRLDIGFPRAAAGNAQ